MNKCVMRAFDASTSSLTMCSFDANGKPVVCLKFRIAGVDAGPLSQGS
jgi:hypothetical protein